MKGKEMGPHLIFWELTQRCNLRCPYCRRDNNIDGPTLEESLRVIDSITEDYSPLLIFSGGEPLIFPHLFEVARYARKKGLKVALATNGTLINEDLAEKIKSSSFHRVAITLDGANQDTNDSLRGSGTFLKVMTSIKYLKSEGIDIQVNTTVIRRNLDEIPLIYNLCLDLDILAWHIFAFVPVGCGLNLPKEEQLSKEEYEDFLKAIANLSLESKIEIKITCAPHYQRILSQRQHNLASILNKGCLAGSGVCFISAEGEVYPCGYLPISAGNILTKEFKEIWADSYLFHTLRNPGYLKGRCGRCEYIYLCGGCRARAYQATGDYLEEEPECVYQPYKSCPEEIR